MAMMTLHGFSSAAPPATCEFTTTGSVPDPEAFVVVIEDASAPSTRPLDAEVQVRVIER